MRKPFRQTLLAAVNDTSADLDVQVKSDRSLSGRHGNALLAACAVGCRELRHYGSSGGEDNNNIPRGALHLRARRAFAQEPLEGEKDA